MISPAYLPAYLLDQLTQFPKANHYRVAYSGGCDSHALLHALTTLRSKLSPTTISAVHIHHGLHKEANAWASHCRSVCQDLGVSCTVLTVNVQTTMGGSPEAMARQVRYQALANLLDDGEGLLLAHHQDDQAETVLLQLLRGAGVRGLSGMPAYTAFASGWLGRPILGVCRTEIHAYAQQHDLQWVEDPSNQDVRYDRNYIRHRILPSLIERWPSASEILSRVAKHQAEAASLLHAMAEDDWQHAHGEDPYSLSITVLRRLPVSRQRNLLRYWISGQCGLPLPATRHVNRILDEILPARKDAMPQVNWDGVEVRRYREHLYAQAPLVSHDPRCCFDWNFTKSLSITHLDLCLSCDEAMGVGLDKEKVELAGLSVRFRLGGERCQPLGRQHHHALKKLFQEHGVPPWQRQRIPLIYIGDELAQVVGYWICEPFQANAGKPGLLIDAEVL